MDEFRKAVRIVEEARDTAALLHSTYVRIQLDQALEVLALVEIKLNTIDNEFIRPTKEKPTQTTGSR